MPRPKRHRQMCRPPRITGWIPSGRHHQDTPIEYLLFEEYESIRLLDYEGMNQEEAANEMQISRPTLTRIYKNARKTLARALVNGSSIVIRGGKVQFANEWYRCLNCHHLFVPTQAEKSSCPECHSDQTELIAETRAHEPVYGKGPGGFCVCPQCHYHEKHQRGIPCHTKECPKCHAPMERENKL